MRRVSRLDVDSHVACSHKPKWPSSVVPRVWGVPRVTGRVVCAPVVLVLARLLQLQLGEAFSRPPSLLLLLTGCVSGCPPPLYDGCGSIREPPGGPCVRDLQCTMGECPWSEPLHCLGKHCTCVTTCWLAGSGLGDRPSQVKVGTVWFSRPLRSRLRFLVVRFDP